MPQKLCHFFILTAFLLGIIAPACGFAWNGKFSVIEICTAKGIEQKIVSNDDLPPKHPLAFCVAVIHEKPTSHQRLEL